MGKDAARTSGELTAFERLRLAREIIRAEGEALLALADRIGERFCQAVDLLVTCTGSVIVTGMGKAGLVGQKISATLASTGTRSHFLHPAEAVHGDLGRIHRGDIVLILSLSGETQEIVSLLPSLRDFHTPIVAITGRATSSLGRAATVTIDLGPIEEAGSLGLAPTTSTTAMLALGDAMALVLSRLRRFGSEDFARFHPGGSLGRKLAKVEEMMRPLVQCRLAEQSRSVREVLVELSQPGRRTGAIMVTSKSGQLTGIFTDSDLARLLESKRDAAIDGPLQEVMTLKPQTVSLGSRMSLAHEIMARRRISELPVVDPAGRPVGLIDVTDVVGFIPSVALSAESLSSTEADVGSSHSTSMVECQSVPFPTSATNKRTA